MATLALYWIPGSCARVPFVALEEAGAEFELRPINRYRGEHETAAYRAVNPKGKVPALQVDETVVTEVPVVVQTLSRLLPEVELLPREGSDEIEALSLMAWFASSLHPAAGMQRFPELYSNETAGLEGIQSKAREELHKGFSILETRLGNGGDWLFERWSAVDVYAFYIWFRVVGSGFDASDFPLYAAHARRCEARPSVARVLDREEVEFAGYEAEGVLPVDLPAHQAGRLPARLMGLDDA